MRYGRVVCKVSRFEGGRPVTDDKILFEFMVLESAQAGLSWITILRKREGYRTAFAISMSNV